MTFIERLPGPSRLQAQLEWNNRAQQDRIDRLCAEIAALRQVQDELDPRLLALVAEYGQEEAADFLEDAQRDLRREAADWTLAPVVASLCALHGIDHATAITILAEIGNLPATSGTSRPMK